MRWKKFHCVFFTYLNGQCGESRWIIYIQRVLSILMKQQLPYTGENLLPPAWLHPIIPLSRSTGTYLYDISWEFKLDSVNFGKQMPWIFGKNLVKCDFFLDPGFELRQNFAETKQKIRGDHIFGWTSTK